MTVYGPGGVDARAPRRGLHPAVLALVIGAVVATLGAAGYWVLRDPEAGPPRAASAAPSAPTTAPSSRTPEPVELAAGEWLVVPADAPDSYLGVTGDDFATVSDDPTVLTVEPGLADAECFTFRTRAGKYLRHFDYRLRFDGLDTSDLFRRDATFCPLDDQPAGVVRLESKNYPGHLVHRRGDRLFIDKAEDSAEFRSDSTFRVRPASRP